MFRFESARACFAFVLACSIHSAFSAESASPPGPSASPAPAEKPWYEKARDTTNQGVHQVTQVLNQTRDVREKSSAYVLATYSPIDLIIPSKIGGTAGWVQNADSTWEIEYLRGSIGIPFFFDDLGSFTDQRLSLLRRSYFGGNSFNVSYGVAYTRLGLHIGDDIMSRLSGGNYPPGIDLVQTDSLGFHVGLGNRWSFDNKITVGVDWISWAQPVVRLKEKAGYLDYASNQQDREDIDSIVKIMSYFPRIVLFKLQVGMVF